uniref:RAD54 homolog B n=1 Tax=Sinocyclocheilus grahami TaxID=75366 RepID=A0A672SIF3_SINGR
MLTFYLSQGALVMPRPTTDHQWLYNKSGSPLVDVVIDPHLTSHLRPHQREGMVFLYDCLMGMRLPGRCRAILADEMGLGKTLQCVCVLWTLLRQGPYGGRPLLKRALVVCPGSLVKNWAAEFNKWLGRERISVYTVDQVCLRGCLCQIIDGLVTKRKLNVCVVSVGSPLLICDEGHHLKNGTIKTTNAVTALSCLNLTGTPVQNDLQEFYSIVEFVNPGILGTSSAYRKIYEEPILRSQWCIGEERAAELFRLTGVFTLRRTQEIINQYLSERIEWTVFCKPTELQLRLYGVLLASLVPAHTLTHTAHTLHASMPSRNSATTLRCSTKLYRYKRCWYFMYEGGMMELFPEGYSTGAFSTADSGKTSSANRPAVNSCPLSLSKVVLVSNYTQTLNLLQDVCDHIAQRQLIVDSFNSPHSSNFLLLLSSKAGGVGLNLIGASHLVLYDIDWNPANDIQAMARVWRDGQRKTVHIYRFLTTGNQNILVDLSKKAEHISFSAEELRDLFSFDPNTTCLTHNLLNCQCTGDGNTSGLKWSSDRSFCCDITCESQILYFCMRLYVWWRVGFWRWAC